jgi:hypothetical protein
MVVLFFFNRTKVKDIQRKWVMPHNIPSTIKTSCRSRYPQEDCLKCFHKRTVKSQLQRLIAKIYANFTTHIKVTSSSTTVLQNFT